MALTVGAKVCASSPSMREQHARCSSMLGTRRGAPLLGRHAGGGLHARIPAVALFLVPAVQPHQGPLAAQCTRTA